MIKLDLQLQDATITCSECGQPFTFSAREQLSHARLGQRQPSLCAFCRAARMIAGGEHNAPGREGHLGRRGEAGGREAAHVMYAAVCARCGRQTKVPFEPRRDRPVYCSDCYQDQQRVSGGYQGGGRGGGRGGAARR